MPIFINGDENPAESDSNGLNIIQIMKSLAFQTKRITGRTNWWTPPNTSLLSLSQSDQARQADIAQLQTQLSNVQPQLNSVQAQLQAQLNSVQAEIDNIQTELLNRKDLFWSRNQTLLATSTTDYANFVIPANTVDAGDVLRLTLRLSGGQITNLPYTIRIGGQTWQTGNFPANASSNITAILASSSNGSTTHNTTGGTCTVNFANNNTVSITSGSPGSDTGFVYRYAFLEILKN